MSNDFRVMLYRLRSGELVIGRQTPQGDIMNPYFIIVEWIEQKPICKKCNKEPENPGKLCPDCGEELVQQPPKKKVSIRPLIEMVDGLTLLEDNYFIKIKKEDISIPFEPANNLVMLYGKVSKEVNEIKSKKDGEAKSDIKSESTGEVIAFPTKEGGDEQ